MVQFPDRKKYKRVLLPETKDQMYKLVKSGDLEIFHQHTCPGYVQTCFPRRFPPHSPINLIPAATAHRITRAGSIPTLFLCTKWHIKIFMNHMSSLMWRISHRSFLFFFPHTVYVPDDRSDLTKGLQTTAETRSNYFLNSTSVAFHLWFCRSRSM